MLIVLDYKWNLSNLEFGTEGYRKKRAEVNFSFLLPYSIVTISKMN